MGVVGGVANGTTDGVMEVATDVATGSVVGTVADNRTYRRGIRMQDEIFSHKRGGGSLPDAPRLRYTTAARRTA